MTNLHNTFSFFNIATTKKFKIKNKKKQQKQIKKARSLVRTRKKT